jgi:hypothetical protein
MYVKLSSEKEASLKVNINAKIIIPQECYAELQAYVEHYTTEVSGCGLVERKDTTAKYKYSQEELSSEFTITEVFLPSKQSNTSGSTDISATTIGELAHKLIEEGKDSSKLRMHWHSHVNMNTFHSGTDEENYRDLDNGEFLVSLVLNKHGSILGRVDFYKPIHISIVDVPVYIAIKNPDGINVKIDKNIKALDKFIESDKKVSRYDNWRDDDSEETKKFHREMKIKERLRLQMKIEDIVGVRYEYCSGKLEGTCLKCKYAEQCREYCSELEKRYGYKLPTYKFSLNYGEKDDIRD